MPEKLKGSREVKTHYTLSKQTLIAFGCVAMTAGVILGHTFWPEERTGFITEIAIDGSSEQFSITNTGTHNMTDTLLKGSIDCSQFPTQDPNKIVRVTVHPAGADREELQAFQKHALSVCHDARPKDTSALDITAAYIASGLSE